METMLPSRDWCSMSASDVAPSVGSSHAIRLQYTLTSEEAAWVLERSVPVRENKLLHRTVVAGAACMAIHSATIGFWIGAAVFGTAAIRSLTRYSGQKRLIKFVFRGEVDYDLIVDREGIRGTFDFRMRIRRWSTTTEVEHRWPQLKSILRVGDYLWLEFPSRKVFGFNMPAGVIIPLEAFEASDDLRLCDAWAESGLREGVR